MLLLPCDYCLSKQIAARGINLYLSDHEIKPHMWYDRCGNITSIPTKFPVISYGVILEWLVENNVRVSVTRIDGTDLFLGRIYQPTQDLNPDGSPVMRRRGRVEVSPDFNGLMQRMIERGILVLPAIFCDVYRSL